MLSLYIGGLQGVLALNELGGEDIGVGTGHNGRLRSHARLHTAVSAISGVCVLGKPPDLDLT